MGYKKVLDHMTQRALNGQADYDLYVFSVEWLAHYWTEQANQLKK